MISISAFFMYFAPGAGHVPLQVPLEWADKYKGKFDGGWDALRNEIFERQQAMGVVPDTCELTDPPPGLSQWDDYDDDMKAVLARQMAGMGEELRGAMAAIFEGEDYRNRRDVIAEHFKQLQEQAFKNLQAKAEARAAREAYDLSA